MATDGWLVGGKNLVFGGLWVRGWWDCRWTLSDFNLSASVEGPADARGTYDVAILNGVFRWWTLSAFDLSG